MPDLSPHQIQVYGAWDDTMTIALHFRCSPEAAVRFALNVLAEHLRQHPARAAEQSAGASS